MNEYNVINSPKIKGSDWNANEGEAGFIKNRTHYENVVEETIGSTTINVPSEWDTPSSMPEYMFMADPSAYTNLMQDLVNVLLSTSKEVNDQPGKIKINNIGYDCYYSANKSEQNGVEFISITCAISKNVLPTPESYSKLYFFYGKAGTNSVIGINTNYFPTGENDTELNIVKPEIKKIDPKFLPEIDIPEGLKNIKDAENGGVIEGLVNGGTGQINVASGKNTHAEGGTTFSNPTTGEITYVINQATGECSHAEGGGTTASGQGSHAEGANTIANHKSQHVFGEYNIVDSSTVDAYNRGTYVEIVGNGNDSTRSNARTLDWSGNEWISGTMRAENGFILKSPDGSLFTLTVANDGTLTATKNV